MDLHRLEVTPLTTILGEILRDRRSGVLAIVSDGARRRVHWAYGDIGLVESSRENEQLPAYLRQHDLIDDAQAAQLAEFAPTDVALHFSESDTIQLKNPLSHLREWIRNLFIPLFSLEQGTVTFEDSEPLPHEKRAMMPTTALVMDGIRSIQSGLILRNALGDISQRIEPAPDPPFGLESLPLTIQEREAIEKLDESKTVQEFLRNFPKGSTVAARSVIAMTTFGIFRVRSAPQKTQTSFDETERDLSILASIGGDTKALEVLSLSKRLDKLDHYRFLDVPLAATRAQIGMRIDEMKQKYETATYPAPVHPAVREIQARINEARQVLLDADQREAYDNLLKTRRAASHRTIAQQTARRSVAIQNYKKAENLSLSGDNYTAIVLLQQAVKFEPDNAKAWHLLGMCQMQNPKWKQTAAESLGRALSIDPNRIDTIIALGDLYLEQNMFTRAKHHYEDVLRIDATNELAQARMRKLTKKQG